MFVLICNLALFHALPSTSLVIQVILVMCSVDELRKLLTDKEAYNAFFNSLDQVKIQNNVSLKLKLHFLLSRPVFIHGTCTKFLLSRNLLHYPFPRLMSTSC